MSKKKDTLLQEAVADAKTLRETALANAKLALEETFTPHLTSMLSTKLKKEAETMEEPGEEYEEISEELDSSDIGGNGVTTDEPAPKEPSAAASDSSDIKNDKSLTEDEEPTLDDEESTDVDAIEPAADVATNDDEEENDLDLEAIIRELEEEPVIDDEDELDVTAEADDESEVPAEEVPAPEADAPVADAPAADVVPSEVSSDDEEEIDLEEILREMEAEDAAEDDESTQSAVAAELEEVKGELKEYRQVVKLLRSRLQETNLLNAKLLYTNKLFKNYNMNVGQKMRVIETFDRAQNVREAKLVFATLAESFGSNGSKKKRVVENTASKVIPSTAPKSEVITEGATLASRFKKLAGIK